jgi:Zn-dependent protease
MVQATGMELAPMQSQFLRFAVTINLILAVFNLIPLFPLDGSHILKSLLPEELEQKLNQFDRFAPLVLILLLISGVIWIFLWPPIAFLISLILGS